MNYKDQIENKLNSDNELIDGKSGALLSAAMSCEIMQMIIKNSLNRFYGISDNQFIKFSDEIEKIKIEFMKTNKVFKEDLELVYLLKDNAYLCKRVLKIGSILKSNSNSSLSVDLDISINLARVSLNAFIALLGKDLNLIENSSIKKELESHIEILAKEDELNQNIMNSPDY